jgi:hypothetical protein
VNFWPHNLPDSPCRERASWRAGPPTLSDLVAHLTQALSANKLSDAGPGELVRLAEALVAVPPERRVVFLPSQAAPQSQDLCILECVAFAFLATHPRLLAPLVPGSPRR